MLEEQLAVITGLWGSDGELLPRRRALPGRGLARAAQAGAGQGRRSSIGGSGKKRTPALAARYADEFNLPFVPFEEGLAQNDRVRRACEAIGRDPAT